MNNKFVLSNVMAASFIGLMALSASAHGKPEHGGAFTEVKEYTFEVVPKEQAEEKNEKAEKERQPHKEKMEFTVYVKDPSLKPVTSGSGSIKITQGSKPIAEAPLSASGEAFKAKATLPHHGRYRIAIDFTPPGEKLIKANVAIKVD